MDAPGYLFATSNPLSMFLATFRVARLTLQTRKLWCRDRLKRWSRLLAFLFILFFLFLFASTKKTKSGVVHIPVVSRRTTTPVQVRLSGVRGVWKVWETCVPLSWALEWHGPWSLPCPWPARESILNLARRSGPEPLQLVLQLLFSLCLEAKASWLHV